ncbi:MAG: prepilin-type N-terminal cleavage/methylation domain-containing protein [Nitrospirales bacterium]|nr:prepilin-type N-terminal cleavage/methylation domain-containing protein [Nitrospirales bacterium]
MPKNLFRPLHRSQGFTLVEMIGVLAIIAILIALLLPKIFTLIASSKASSLAAAVRTYETAVAKYYGDIGTIWPLNAAGTPAQENGGNSVTVTSLGARLTLDASDPLNTGANQWSRFRGPYLEKFNTNTPPGLGTTMYMPAQTAVALGTATTGTNVGWDLKGDDGNSDLPTGARVAYLRVDGVSDTEFNEIDGVIDAGIGTSLTERQLRGRVKYNPGNDRLYIYLTHQ